MTEPLIHDRGWHADAEALQQYADGRADLATAWSVEAHLTGCPDCRRLLAHALAPSDVTLLEGTRRLLSLPPPARRRRTALASAVLGPLWAWGALVLAVLGLLLLARQAPVASTPDRAGLTWLSVLAPLVPVAMVAAVYAVADRDPAAVATPRGGLELVLLRTSAVLTASLVVVFGGLWALGAAAVAWVLPGLGLSLTALVLGTWTGIERAAVVLTGGWAVVVAAVMTPRSPVVGRLGGLVAPSGAETVVWAIVLLALAVLLVARRGRFDVPVGVDRGHHVGGAA